MKKSLTFRSWYYFRAGYSQYFGFILAMVNMLTLTYYLALNSNEIFAKFFPSFSAYVIISSMIGIPLLIIIGFLHMRRSRGFSSETEVVNESLPYNYKLPPGVQKEIIAPLLLQLLIFSRKSLTNDKISNEETLKTKEILEKFKKIETDGSLDMPKKFDDL